MDESLKPPTPDGAMKIIYQTDLIKGAVGGGISTQILLTVAAVYELVFMWLPQEL